MKTFTTIKVGYTAGIYGCSNEYFTTIYTDSKDGLKSFCFYGMYGAEERIAREMVKQGFTETYTASNYGRMTRRDINKNLYLSEEETIREIRSLVNMGNA